MSDKKEKAPEKEGWERIQGLIEVQICIYIDRYIDADRWIDRWIDR
jgi:hypothetical protein